MISVNLLQAIIVCKGRLVYSINRQFGRYGLYLHAVRALTEEEIRRIFDDI